MKRNNGVPYYLLTIVIMIKLLVFDLDGTLVDSKVDLWQAVNFSLQCKSLPPCSLGEVTSFIGNGARQLIEQSLMHTLNHHVKKISFAMLPDENLIEEVLQIFMSYYIDHCSENTTLYDGVRKFLADNKYSKVVLTNKPKIPAIKILDHLKILPYFSTVLGGDSEFGKKPNPAGLQYLLKINDCLPKEAILIGDGLQDAQAAQAAEVPFIAYLGGLGSHELNRLENSSTTLESFSDLNHILAQL